ncbi:cytidine deaminase-like protein [Wolfiporia cocos MD-104 SS10]|uniref:Cytidine deaminase-like protein n=1 Tax=Wolfiporia cocos (strain MD-104) TaxID=742152 RepID=A0A2H3JFM2_WOLCO|nr:cytidine deaminase-like protein [Wolfiporia cocos MD-104 SS10]
MSAAGSTRVPGVNEISTRDRERLIEAALAARENAYSSRGHPPFRVGAALLAADGRVVAGASVDCVSSGERRVRGVLRAVCAERTAMVAAVSEGMRAFRAVAIASDVPQPVSPCGLCRQVLDEFCTRELAVLLVPGDYRARVGAGDAGGGVRVLALGALLPMVDGPFSRMTQG